MPYVRRNKKLIARKRTGYTLIRKKGARRYRKNPYKVRSKGYASAVVIKQPSGLPDRLFVKLRYREQLSFAQAIGALSENVYRGNSIFDPDQSGAGGQPFLFDQWANFYSTYRVLASSIKAYSFNNGQTYNNMVVIAPSPQATTFGTTGQELIEELPYSKRRVARMGSNDAGQSYITHYMTTSKILGKKKSVVQNEDNLASDTSTNPVDQWYWHLANWVPGGTGQSLIQDVILTYYVVFETRARGALS